MIKPLDLNRKILVILLNVIFLCFVSNYIHGQMRTGQPDLKIYTYKDFQSDPTNVWINEGENGIMYFSNLRGLLKYDGLNWDLIPTVYGQGSTSVAIGDDGVIYVGTQNEFGYLEISETGTYYYKSLRHLIPEEHRSIDRIWDCHVVDGKATFWTTNKMFIYDGNDIEVKVFDFEYHVAALVRGKLYSRFWNRGLCEYDGTNFNLVPNGDKFANERIYTILPFGDEELLIGVRNLGLFIYNGVDFRPFKTDIDDLIKDTIYIPGIALDSGNYLINSLSGAYIIDNQGKLVQEFNVGVGIADNRISYAFQDSSSVIWMVANGSIIKVNPNSPFTFFNDNNGLSEQITIIRKFKDISYLGSQNGLYYLDEKENRIKKVEGTKGQIFGLEVIAGKLIASSNEMGLLEINGDSYSFIRPNLNYDFRPSQILKSRISPNKFWVNNEGSRIHLFAIDTIANKITQKDSIDLVLSSTSLFFETEDKILLDMTDDNRISYLKKPLNKTEIPLNSYETGYLTKEDGVPEDLVASFGTEDEILVISNNGIIYKYDLNTSTFVKDSSFLASYLDLSKERLLLRKDKKGNIYFDLGTGLKKAYKGSNGEYIINEELFSRLDNHILGSVFIDDSSIDDAETIWINEVDGLIKYSPKYITDNTYIFNTIITGIKSGEDSLIYGGAGKLPKQLNLPYDRSNVSFEYVATNHAFQESIEYSTKLEGFDSKWSIFTKRTSRDYNNLPPGDYNFKVIARSPFMSTDETNFAFNITTPWYKTWWAYGLFSFAFILLILAIVRSRTSILRTRQKELEVSVEERTKEVQKRLDELNTVNTVSRALTEKIELNELIQKVGDEMKRLFNSDITYVALVDKQDNIIRFPYQDGDDIAPQKFGEGLTSKIITTGEPLLINKDVDISAEYEKMGVKGSGKPAVSYLGVPIPSEDEIVGVLSVQSTEVESRFNEEDKRLLNTIAINVGVALHNAELFEEVKIAMAKAEDANEAKSAFLSTVSHELRTPLTSVLGFAKIIRKRLEDKIFPAVKVEDQKIKRTMQQVTENLNVVVSEGERLTNLINDVLDLAKIESGKMEWTMKPVFLQDAINRAIASTQSLFDNKEIELNKNIPSDLPLVSADEDKLIQVVINLLSNAVKFTDKGRVAIEAYLEKDQIIVEIQDTGIGISEEDKHKVFERFRQAGDTLTDKPKGTGLGLPICREIIEHHGGIIWMKSEAGVGSTFFFSIPALGEGVKQQPIQLDRILKSLKKQIKHSSFNTDLKYVPTILVVDDDTPIRSLLRQELGEAGYNVTEAANGKAALDMVRNSKPDLIILDVMMPEINGFDVAAVLKNDPATMDIPIIILSIVQDKERGLKIGVDRYLTKPINTEQLFSEVDALLEQGVSKKKVLVVDEDASAVKSLSDVLSARGYKVMESNGQNMVQAATESQPDIIMLNSVYNGDQKIIRDLKQQKGMENVMFFIYE